MNSVKVLVEGYAYKNDDGSYTASPTTTLVESNGVKFLVDPGANPDLPEVLKENNLEEKDLSFIYLTHYHPDHFLNLQFFPTLPVYDGEIGWIGDREVFHQGKLPGVDVEILKTPGHSPEHTSLLVKTEEGMVCIAADVFWWEDGMQTEKTYEGYINMEDPFAVDEEDLINSRVDVLIKANFIIPGHGKMFKAPTRKSAERDNGSVESL